MRFAAIILCGIFLLCLPFKTAQAGFEVTQICMHAPPQPVITVTAVPGKPVFNTKKTRQDLAVFKKAAGKEHHSGEVRGVMHGLMGARYQISHNQYTDKKAGWGCLFFSRIDITLTLDPQIFLASDLHHNACLYRDVLKHEIEHLQTDKMIMKKYERQIADGMRLAFSMPGDYTTGPVPISSFYQRQKQMEETVGLALNVLFKKMMAERQKRQDRIDSHRYRTNHAC